MSNVKHPFHYSARLAKTEKWAGNYNNYHAARQDADRTIRRIRPEFREGFTARYEPAPQPAPEPQPKPRTRTRWQAVTGQP